MVIKMAHEREGGVGVCVCGGERERERDSHPLPPSLPSSLSFEYRQEWRW